MLTIAERLRITHECTAGFNRATWLPEDWNLLNEAADELDAANERAERYREALESIMHARRNPNVALTNMSRAGMREVAGAALAQGVKS